MGTIMLELNMNDELASAQKNLRQVEKLLQKNKLLETLTHKKSQAELRVQLDELSSLAISHILEALPPDDREVIWQLIADERKYEIQQLIPDYARTESPSETQPHKQEMKIRAFGLQKGRLQQIPINNRDDLAQAKPIWIDFIAPDEDQIAWTRELFDVELPNPSELTDLETSARFYIENSGAMHLHSDFLLDREDDSRNVAVAFILHKGTLFSVCSEELPVFRLQRLRARTQANYVSEDKDVLLDLYAADVEYSANALEDVYAKLGSVGQKVLRSHITDDEAADILASIAAEEDLNGRIRRNVLDTRRALSFLMRSKSLSESQHEDVHDILRDIESLDGHTAFLFNKINFLMDSIDSSININQNKDIKRLTVISVVFMPLNVLAGIGGMSEYSMMTSNIPWPIAYAGFTFCLVIVGWLTFTGLRHFEQKKTNYGHTASRNNH